MRFRFRQSRARLNNHLHGGWIDPVLNPAFLALNPKADGSFAFDPTVGTGSATFTRATTALTRVVTAADGSMEYIQVASGKERIEGAIKTPLTWLWDGNDATSDVGALGQYCDTSTDRWTLTPSGVSDTKVCTYVVWFRQRQPIGGAWASTKTVDVFRGVSGWNGLCIIGSASAGTNRIWSQLTNSAGTLLGRYETSILPYDNQWHCFMLSVDTTTGTERIQQYLDDVSDSTAKVSLVADGVMDWTRNWDMNVGGGANTQIELGPQYFNCDASIDLSVEANRRLFIDSLGRPVDCGADGSTPTGSQPASYFKDGDPANNLGYAGNFVPSGSLVSVAGPVPACGELRPTVALGGLRRFKTHAPLTRSTALTALTHYVPDTDLDGQRYYQCTAVDDRYESTGASGDAVETPHAAGNDVTGTGGWTVIFKHSTATWTGGGLQICGKYELTGNKRSWTLQQNNQDQYQLTWSEDGTSGTNKSFSWTLPDPLNTAGHTWWCKMVVDPDNGASDATGDMYYSYDYDPDTETGTWTQIQSQKLLGSASTGPASQSTVPFQIGAYGATRNGGPLAVRMYYLALYKDITQTTVTMVMDARGQAGETSWVSTTGETWTEYGAGSMAAGATEAVAPSTLSDGNYTLGETILDGGCVLVDKGHYTVKGYLAEPQRTNLLLHSRNPVSGAGWSSSVALGTLTQDQVGIDGTSNSATYMEDDNATQSAERKKTETIANDGTTYCASAYFKKTSGGETAFPGILLFMTGGTDLNVSVVLHTQTGVATPRAATDAPDAYGVIDCGDWWRLWFTKANNTSGNTSLQFWYLPAFNDDAGNAIDATSVGTCIVDAAQVEAASTPSSYIFTTTAAVQRNRDTLQFADGNVPPAAGYTMFADLMMPVLGVSSTEEVWRAATGTLLFYVNPSNGAVSVDDGGQTTSPSPAVAARQMFKGGIRGTASDREASSVGASTSAASSGHSASGAQNIINSLTTPATDVPIILSDFIIWNEDKGSTELNTGTEYDT